MQGACTVTSSNTVHVIFPIDNTKVTGVFPTIERKYTLLHLSSQWGLPGMNDNNGKDKPIEQKTYPQQHLKDA